MQRGVQEFEEGPGIAFRAQDVKVVLGLCEFYLKLYPRKTYSAHVGCEFYLKLYPGKTYLAHVEQVTVYASVHLDLRALVRPLPPGTVPAVRGVSWRVVGQKIPVIGIPERVGNMSLRSVVSVDRVNFRDTPYSCRYR